MKISIVTLMMTLTIIKSQGQTIVDSVNYNCNHRTKCIAEIIEKFKIRYLGNSTPYKIKDNKINVKGVIQFLNEDFRTNVFNKFCFMEYSNFQFLQKGSAQLGFINISFQTDRDLVKAASIIRKTKRSNFKLEVLTRFKLITKNNSLILIFSETPSNSLITKYFKDMHSL